MAAEIEPKGALALSVLRMLPLDKVVPVSACGRVWHVRRCTERHVRLGVAAAGVCTWRSKHNIILAVDGDRFQVWVPWTSALLYTLPTAPITRLVETVLQISEQRYNATYCDLILRINQGELTEDLKAARTQLKRELFSALYGKTSPAWKTHDYRTMEEIILANTYAC